MSLPTVTKLWAWPQSPIRLLWERRLVSKTSEETLICQRYGRLIRFIPLTHSMNIFIIAPNFVETTGNSKATGVSCWGATLSILNSHENPPLYFIPDSHRGVADCMGAVVRDKEAGGDAFGTFDRDQHRSTECISSVSSDSCR